MAFSQVFHLAPMNNTWVVTNGKLQSCIGSSYISRVTVSDAFAFCRYFPTELWIEETSSTC